MKLKLAQLLLVFIGVSSVLMGLHFIFLRPDFVFFPEDSRYTQLSSEQLYAHNGNLFTWIGFVFRSWGAFALSTGVLIMGIAAYSLRKKAKWAYITLTLAGPPTLSIFLFVNLSLKSDFIGVIGLLLILYIAALLLAFEEVFKKKNE